MATIDEIFTVVELDPFGSVPDVTTLGCESVSSSNLCLVDVPNTMLKSDIGDKLRVSIKIIPSDVTTSYLESHSKEFDIAIRGIILSIKSNDERLILKASVCGMDAILDFEKKCLKKFSIHDEILFCLKML